jgi:2-alkyl-3-oxoalkanoate reductase
MQALVTGASGFIGSHVVERLVRAGFAVRGLVRQTGKAARVRASGAEPCFGDITSPPSLKQAVQGIDVVFHLAARVTDWGPWPPFARDTVTGTENVLRAAAEAKASRFVLVSTVNVYDDRVADRMRVVTEDVPHNDRGDRALGYYSLSKLRAEAAAWRYHQRGDLAVSVLRPAWVYGPRDETILPRLIDFLRSPMACWIGRRDPVVDPVYVTDVAEAVLAAATRPESVGQAYNVAPVEEVRLRTFFGALCSQLDVPLPRWTAPYGLVKAATLIMEVGARSLHFRDPPPLTRAGLALVTADRHHDPAKAERELGWRAVVSLEEGVRRTAEWMKAGVTQAGLGTA